MAPHAPWRHKSPLLTANAGLDWTGTACRANLVLSLYGDCEVNLEMRDPLTNQFGDAPPMEPDETRDIRFTFNVDGPIGRPGKAISAVVAVSDHLGRAHKFKFKRMQPISERPSKAG